MKNLKTYLEELFATPMNTTGMGNVSPPEINGEVGSGDILQPLDIVDKKIKKYKKLKKKMRIIN